MASVRALAGGGRPRRQYSSARCAHRCGDIAGPAQSGGNASRVYAGRRILVEWGMGTRIDLLERTHAAALIQYMAERLCGAIPSRRPGLRAGKLHWDSTARV